jgi:molybdopterin synthase catalytic subunit
MELPIAGGATPEDVFAELCQSAPALAALRGYLRCAVDHRYAEWDAPVADGAEIAFIPPTAGG